MESHTYIKLSRWIWGMTLSVAAGLTAPVFAQELEPNRPPETKATLDNPRADWGANYTNWVDVGVGAFIMGDGSRASFEQRHQMPGQPFGGIESLHLEGAVGTNGTFSVDGRGIFNNHDYDLELGYTRNKLGYARVGFREFRTWYDVHGGFYPIGDIWKQPFDREAAVDRGSVWAEFGLRLEDVPELTFRYEHQYRDGTKDSTIWGDTNVNLGTGAANLRSIVPSFRDLDEKRDIFAADLRHSIGNTGFGIGLRYDIIDQENSLNILRRPGEASQRYVTQNDNQNSDMVNAHAFTETRISDEVLLTTGFSFTRLDTDMGGSRIYGTGFEAVYDPTFRRQAFDEGFLDLTGDSRLDQYTASISLLATPVEHLSIVPALRLSWENEAADSWFTETNFAPPTAPVAVEEPIHGYNNRDYLEVAESLEVRWTGFTNWVLYARGEWGQDQGNLKQNSINVDTGAGSPSDLDADRYAQKYSAGINWYPVRRVSLALQYYHKIRDVSYENQLGPAPTNYPGFIQDQDFNTDDVNFRVTLRPLVNLTLVTRYDFQLSTIDTRGDSLAEIQSAETTSHIISETASWSPFSRLYLQGSFNFVLDETDTPADSLTGAAQGLVLPAKNDYWNASLLAGYALNARTDLQAQYIYYRANNYQSNALYSQPYNAGDEEQGVTLTLIRNISSALRWTLKYGFFTNHDQTYGGHTDYNTHLVYSSLQYRF